VDEKEHILGQDFWKGTSQSARLLKELVPDYVKVDELTLNDLVRFTDEYAREIILHRDKDAVLGNGNWRDFLRQDYLYLLFFMTNTPTEKIRGQFMQTLDEANRLSSFEYRRNKCIGLLSHILDLGNYIYSWYENMDYNDYTQDLVFALREIVENQLKPRFADLHALKPVILWHESVNEKNEIEIRFDELHKKWNIPATEHQRSLFLHISDNDLEKITAIFNKLFFITEKLAGEARKVLNKVLNNSRNNSAHISLFIAFLQLYQKAQGELNQITRRHLEHYYNRILRQSADDTRPDSAYLCLGLAKGTDFMVMPKDTAFVADKDENGQNMIYTCNEDTPLTSARIAALHTLYVSRNPDNYSGLDTPPVSDIFCSSQEPGTNNAYGWALFGEDQFFRGEASRTMQDAALGFVIASDALHLNEGDRDISVFLEADKESYDYFKSLIAVIARQAGESESITFIRIFLTAFDFWYTLNGEEIKAEHFAIKDYPEQNAIALHFEIPVTEGPMSGIKPGKDIPPLPVYKPYVKLLLRPESHIYAYPLIQALQIANVHIRTRVNGVKDLQLYNHYGQINPAVPFPPFGVTPQVGSYFVIGSNEVFSKKLRSLSLQISWFQLPRNENGWEDYFAGYTANVSNNDYTIQLSYLKDGQWHPTWNTVESRLFCEKTERGYTTRMLADTTILPHINLQDISFAPYAAKGPNPFHNKTRDGYLKLEFSSPAFGFGHADYARRLSEVIMHNSRLKPGDTGVLPEPMPPLSPLASDIQLHYTAEVSAFEDEKATHAIDLYLVTPFGYKSTPLRSAYEKVSLLENLEDEGTLYIGLDSYPEGGYINLFFQLLEGRVEDYIRKVPEPGWQFLANNNWYDFGRENILSDSTAGFIQSGIVRLRIPDDIRTGNTILPGNLYWIKVSVTRKANVAAAVQNIYVNAATVTWDQNGSKHHLDKPLPAFTIKKLRDKLPGLKDIIQPLPSFNGKKTEDTLYFYQRVSERLRHKHRAISVWDYERLVLHRFPLIEKVKCFTANAMYHHADFAAEQKFMVPPGQVKIVLIPDINNPEVRNLLRPKVGISVLLNIRNYLKTIASPFTEIEVMNPFYERVKVIASVKLKEGLLDEGYYQNRLNEDLRSYLTPWLWDRNGDGSVFGSSVFVSRISSYIQGLPYIDFVSGLSVIKTWNDRGMMGLSDSRRNPNPEEIKALYPWSILVSADEHDLTVMRKENYVKPEQRGIGNMLIGSDFIISD